jgi:ketosteroid isomerase-like protein
MTESNDVHNAIVAANEIFMVNFSRGDAAGLAALYTENAKFLPPNSDFVSGKEAIQTALQGLIDSGLKTLKLETLEVEGYGDTASEVGKYILGGEDNEVMDEGKYIVIWKQEAGQWKLHRDMINSSMPAE